MNRSRYGLFALAWLSITATGCGARDLDALGGGDGAGGGAAGAGGAGSNGVFRWTEAEGALKTRFSAKSLDGLQASADNLNGDIHADATYRAHLIGVMARRAVQAAAARE